MLDIKKEFNERSKTGASEAGSHFYGEYLSCPRKFYLGKIKGLRGLKVSKALTYGKIFHDMVEFAFLGEALEDIVAYGEYAIEASKPLYSSIVDHSEDLAYVAPMITMWFNNAFDPKEKLIEVEKSHVLRLENDLKVTGRLDRVLEIDGKLAIVDTKTSKGQWASLTKPLKAAIAGDQFTLYRLMVMQDYDIDYVPEVYIDSIMCKTYVKNGVVAQAARLKLPDITLEELLQVKRQYSGLIEHVGDVLTTFANDTSKADYLFPRSSILCSTYGCEFEKVCRWGDERLTSGEINDTFTLHPLDIKVRHEVEENIKKEGR